MLKESTFPPHRPPNCLPVRSDWQYEVDVETLVRLVKIVKSAFYTLTGQISQIIVTGVVGTSRKVPPTIRQDIPCKMADNAHPVADIVPRLRFRWIETSPDNVFVVGVDLEWCHSNRPVVRA